jgi:hypothetical protein
MSIWVWVSLYYSYLIYPRTSSLTHPHPNSVWARRGTKFLKQWRCGSGRFSAAMDISENKVNSFATKNILYRMSAKTSL